MDSEKTISEYFTESFLIKDQLLTLQIDNIVQITDTIINAYKNGNKTIWFGNGGSAADAQHLACELVSRFFLERKALASIALTTNTSELTAIANDYSFENIFSRQVEALVNPGDVVIGISTSGNSLNVIEGLKKAKQLKAVTVGFTGNNGGKIREIADYLIDVPSEITPHIQESHIMIGHIICQLVEKELFDANEK
ncbi:sugar isomerase (SIS) [Methanolacinia petrolearia DSM 11571]|uniref:Probable phosphoheptose isomerase n=1 Tax=Methanolacinia petrolearia (strain DSM 11571 / OCM 486 / SEBR 4847) TaxID=679926 RepID=E1REY2_METP4|nr:D-sedoheptulose 7-phosphate isomerase [Methanolacinia petrolearia]ADN36153.1 sugar isomerase (SIS) [Methanolacinia petrolearia DSM 11571]